MILFLPHKCERQKNVQCAWKCCATTYMVVGGCVCVQATVTGDTVGDPFKDTAGPSLHVFIKLLSTVTLVMAPLFVPKTIQNSAGEDSVVVSVGETLFVLGLSTVLIMYFAGFFDRCLKQGGNSDKPSI